MGRAHKCIVIYPQRVSKLFPLTIHPPARKKQHLSSSALHKAAETAWRSSSVSTPCDPPFRRA
jgi:hypothetical protein